MRLQPALDPGRGGRGARGDYGIAVFAIKGEDHETYYDHIRAALAHGPNMTMDDGADLVSSLLFLALGRDAEVDPVVRAWAKGSRPPSARRSSTASSAAPRRRRPASFVSSAMEKAGVLKFPVVAVNEAKTKHFFDNRYGTGQSTLDGIIRATNLLLAGLNVVVAGYGWCGRGVAIARARPRGARHRHGDRSDQGDRGGARRLPRHDDGRGGADRRHLRDRDRQQARAPRRALPRDEGRRGRLQLRPLQRRDRHSRAREARHRAAGPSGTRSRSSRCATGAGSTCWPTDG